MALPAVFATVETSAFVREEVSVGVSILLLATYGAYIAYSYFSKEARAQKPAATKSRTPAGGRWSLSRSMGVLAAAVVATAIASELLVEAVEPVSRSIGLSQFFLGLIVIPIIGNVVGALRRDRVRARATGWSCRSRSPPIRRRRSPSSSRRVLVLVSLVLHPMNLIFQPIELVTLFCSAAIFAYISLDGETNWLEGVQLLALYLIAAVSFFFLPGAP